MATVLCLYRYGSDRGRGRCQHPPIRGLFTQAVVATGKARWRLLLAVRKKDLGLMAAISGDARGQRGGVIWPDFAKHPAAGGPVQHSSLPCPWYRQPPSEGRYVVSEEEKASVVTGTVALQPA